MSIPTYYKYIIIGAGIHGLSTAWHLAKELRYRGRGSGNDILVIDKTAIGAGASGIARFRASLDSLGHDLISTPNGFK